MHPRSSYILSLLLLTTGCRGGDLFTDVPECAWDFVFGCNDGESWGLPSGNLTHLNVTTETTGLDEDVDRDGYRLRVSLADSVERESVVGTNGLVTLTFSPPAAPEGDRRVELSEVAGNCTVTSENPQTVAVLYDSLRVIWTDVLFTVDCLPAA